MNKKYQQYNKRANFFFFESNNETFNTLSQASKNHLEHHLITNTKKKVAFLTPRASNVRFSSFNQKGFTVPKPASKLEQESLSLHRFDLTTSNKSKSRTSRTHPISVFESEDPMSRASNQPRRFSRYGQKGLEMTAAKGERVRAKSHPIEHSRDLVYEWEMMGMFFKKLYGENKYFVIQKSKTFYLYNAKMKL